MAHKEHHPKGFTLIEAVITIGLTAIVLLAVSGLVSRLFGTYRTVRTSQSDMQNIRTSADYITKVLRTSTIMQPQGSHAIESSQSFDVTTSIYAYDHTQNRCVIFQFNAGKLEFGSVRPNGSSDTERRHNCDFGSITSRSFTRLSPSTVMGSFVINASKPHNGGSLGSVDSSAHAGLVMVRLTTTGAKSLQSTAQFTVALRDYEYMGFRD